MTRILSLVFFFKLSHHKITNVEDIARKIRVVSFATFESVYESVRWFEVSFQEFLRCNNSVEKLEWKIC